MVQVAKVVQIDDNIEEKVTLEIDGIEFVGFANIVPYEIHVGSEYRIDLGVTILDEFELSESEQDEFRVERCDEGFKYRISGKLKSGGLLDAGIVLEDEFFEEFDYLLDKYIDLDVDRISVEFLK